MCHRTVNSVYYKTVAIDIHGNKSLPSEEASIILVGVEKDNEQPLEFAVSQNFPNPFNPSTTISYSIPTSEFVTLKVFDVLGREVATLVNEEKPNGIYKVDFDGSGLSSGIYFYTLKAGKFTQTRKLVLMK
ncbi:MAG: T9SS type A sorting domain-containing protein [Flavisolibacter sp.]